MTEKSNYADLEQAYDAFVEEMVPNLRDNTVNLAVEGVNSLVSLVRPTNWARILASPDASADVVPPAKILGVTRDGEKVVYADGSGKLPFYRARPFDEVRTALTRLRDRYEASHDGETADLERCMLDKLESLRQHEMAA